MDTVTQRKEKVTLAIEIAIKVSIIAFVVYLSYLIAKPFMAIVVWGVIIGSGFGGSFVGWFWKISLNNIFYII
jgi:hypothetical protein